MKRKFRSYELLLLLVADFKYRKFVYQFEILNWRNLRKFSIHDQINTLILLISLFTIKITPSLVHLLINPCIINLVKRIPLQKRVRIFKRRNIVIRVRSAWAWFDSCTKFCWSRLEFHEETKNLTTQNGFLDFLDFQRLQLIARLRIRIEYLFRIKFSLWFESNEVTYLKICVLLFIKSRFFAENFLLAFLKRVWTYPQNFKLIPRKSQFLRLFTEKLFDESTWNSEGTFMHVSEILGKFFNKKTFNLWNATHKYLNNLAHSIQIKAKIWLERDIRFRIPSPLIRRATVPRSNY